jgi:hypothetical protein
MPAFDAVIVPGGGLLDDCTLPPWVLNRFERAIDRAGGAPIIALSAGTFHKPRPVYESLVGAQWLIAQGYPADRVLTETSSWDTIGNAYFARTIHTDPARFHNLLIVNSEFHMPRTEAIFRWIFGLAPQAGQLTFETVPDQGLSPEALAARQARESASLAKLAHLQSTFTTLAAVHQWLFTNHEAYAAGLIPTRSQDPAVLKSY